MNKRHRAEIKAGLFINLGLILFAVALFFFGSRIAVFRKSVRFFFHLDDAQGLITGTKVYVAGIDAGKVDALSLDPETNRVRIEIDVADSYQDFVHRNGGIELNTQGVLGDRAVYINPGSPSEPLIRPGGEIPVRETAGLKSLVSRGDQLMRDLDRLILNLDRFATHLNHDVDLGKADDAFGKLDDILGKIDSGQGTLGAFLNDPSLYDDAKSLVGEANSNRILRNIIRKSVQDAKERG